jgi:hypothetical protein
MIAVVFLEWTWTNWKISGGMEGVEDDMKPALTWKKTCSRTYKMSRNITKPTMKTERSS